MHQNKNEIHINDGGNIETQTVKHDLQKISWRDMWKQIFIKYKKQNPAYRIEDQQDAKPL